MKKIFITAFGLLSMAYSVSAQTYDLIERRNSWNAGENVTGIRMDSVSISYAELYGKGNQGEFRNTYEAEHSWNAGAVAKSITHLKGYSLTGSFSFDHTSGRNMSGSMFIYPGVYPVDALEFTPGRKDLQRYAFTGGIAADIAPHWRLGGKIDFAASNYSKRKDLRHTNYRLDLKAAPAVMYHSGHLAVGFSYILGKNSESVKAEVIGTAESSYYAFLDKGLLYGTYQIWDGSGTHLSETGVSGFPVKEVSNGAAVQLQWKDFYGDIEYTYASGSAGERETVWFNFPSHRLASHLSYRFQQGKSEHFLRLNLQYVNQVNNENVLYKETANGITTTYANGSNRIFERDAFLLHPEYEWVSPRAEIRLGMQLSSFKQLSTLMYPYVASEKRTCSLVYLSGELHIGRFDLKAAASFANGSSAENNRVVATEMEAGEPPYRLTDYYLLQKEYATAPQASLHLGLRYHFTEEIYAEIQGGLTHGFHLIYIKGASRWSEAVKLGYTF